MPRGYLFPCLSLGLFEAHPGATTVLVNEFDARGFHGFGTSIELPEENWVRLAKVQAIRQIVDVPYLLLVISRRALSRRAAARHSYRSSLMSSGSARRTASAVRSGSPEGIVTNGSIRRGTSPLPIMSRIFLTPRTFS